jgi:hypothetical protein
LEGELLDIGFGTVVGLNVVVAFEDVHGHLLVAVYEFDDHLPKEMWEFRDVVLCREIEVGM